MFHNINVFITLMLLCSELEGIPVVGNCFFDIHENASNVGNTEKKQ